VIGERDEKKFDNSSRAAAAECRNMKDWASAAIVVVVSNLSLWSIASAQDDPLSAADYQWLHANLNVERESLTLQDLTQSQKTRVHMLINRLKVSADKRLMATADYLYRINGKDFDNTLGQSEELIIVSLPSRD
jgi:hypothetical protein